MVFSDGIAFRRFGVRDERQIHIDNMGYLDMILFWVVMDKDTLTLGMQLASPISADSVDVGLGGLRPLGWVGIQRIPGGQNVGGDWAWWPNLPLP